jgi:sRNA-binding regulator protein Hfq
MTSDPQPSPLADLEQLAQAKFNPLSEAETRLVRAAARGETACCGPQAKVDDPGNDPAESTNWGPERSIRAELIRWLCVNRDARDFVDSRGIRVQAARIVGAFESPFVVVPFALGFARCSFWDNLDLRSMEVSSLDLSGTWLPYVNLDHATVKGSITLSNVRSTGLQLCGARIGGNLECENAVFQNPAKSDADWSGVAIDATNAKVDGAVLLRNGFVAEGAVRLFSATIGESLDCAGGKFSNLVLKDCSTSGVAFDASYANVTGNVLLNGGFAAEGAVRVYGTQVGGGLDCENGTFRSPARQDIAGTGIALEATDIKVSGAVSFRKGFTAEGQVRMYNAQIGGNLDCEAGSFRNPIVPSMDDSGIALNLEGASVGRVIYLRRGFVAVGMVRIFTAKIAGTLDCEGGKFDNPLVPGKLQSGIALSIEGTKVEGAVHLCNGFVAEGAVWMRGAQIDWDLDCDGGRFNNPPLAKVDDSGFALNAEGVTVGGAAYFRNGFVANGMVRMFAAKIGGNLECDGGKFHNPAQAGIAGSGMALNLEGAGIAGAVYLRNKFGAEGHVRLYSTQIEGDLEFEGATFESLNLEEASARAILDDKESWPKPGQLSLDGFTYGRIAHGPITAKERLDWLARQESFARHPYRQLAHVLKESGDNRGWRLVSAKMEQRTWDAKSWPWIARPTSWLLRNTIAYGYFPGNALWWLLALVLTGSALYHLGYEAGSMVPVDKDAYTSFVAQRQLPGNYEAFYAIPYSLENSFPVVKLGIEDDWVPGPGERVTTPGTGTSWLVSRIASPRFLQVFRWIQICLGWILGTLFVGGVTGVIRND